MIESFYSDHGIIQFYGDIPWSQAKRSNCLQKEFLALYPAPKSILPPATYNMWGSCECLKCSFWFQHRFLSFFVFKGNWVQPLNAQEQRQVMKHASPAHTGLPIIKYTWMCSCSMVQKGILTLSRKYRSCVMATTVPLNSARYRSSQATASASRWFVGSSSSRISGVYKRQSNRSGIVKKKGGGGWQALFPCFNRK